jgi:hypothetical protein
MYYLTMEVALRAVPFRTVKTAALKITKSAKADFEYFKLCLNYNFFTIQVSLLPDCYHDVLFGVEYKT